MNPKDPISEILENNSVLFEKVINDLTLSFLEKNHLSQKHFLRIHDEIVKSIEHRERSFAQWHLAWLGLFHSC